MIRQISFVKASGAGNDFVIIDNHEGRLQCDFSKLSRALCAPHIGIGADGLLVLDPALGSDFRMQYYNADGSSGGMCGNGGRCIAQYAHLSGLTGVEMRFEALGHVYEASILGSKVRLRMKDPAGYRPAMKLTTDTEALTASFIDTGAPHAVIFVEDTGQIDVSRLGREVRHHRSFAPGGTNVNFVKATNRTSIELRTYERGVEAETLACGTGSIAAALVSALERGIDLPVRVRVRSGEDLFVDARKSEGSYTDITLEGGADILFTGVVKIDDFECTIAAINSL